MAKEEAARVERQRNELGEAGLMKKAQELSTAVEHNEIPPPIEMLTKVPIPNVNSINSLPSTVQTRGQPVFGDVTKLTNLNLDKFPIPINVTACAVDSNFGYVRLSTKQSSRFIFKKIVLHSQITVYFNTSNISTELRPYLLLFLELITESPIRRPDGTLIPYEEVVAALEKDTVSLQTCIGIESSKQFSCGSYSQTVVLMLKTDHKKFVRGIQWVVDLLNNTEFTPERIRVCSSKIANAVSQAKRNGNSVTHDTLKAVYYTLNSNVRRCSMIHQQRFLNALIEKCDKPDQIIADLNRIRQEIMTPNRMSLYIAGDWKKLLDTNEADFNENWKKLIKVDEGVSFE